jgi:hypothetical protein
MVIFNAVGPVKGEMVKNFNNQKGHVASMFNHRGPGVFHGGHGFFFATKAQRH